MELHRYAGLKGKLNNDAAAQEPGALRARSPLAVKLVGRDEQQVILGHRQSSGSR